MSVREMVTNLVIGGRSVQGVRAVRSTKEEVARLRRETAGADRVSRGLSRTMRQKGPILGSVARQVATVAAAYLSVNTAVRTFNRLIDEGDALAKLSTQTRFGVEALQEYRFAAELAGITNTQFDDSIQRLNRRLGLFVNSGGGPAAQAFRALGIEALDAEGKVRSTEAVFEDIISTLSQYDSEARIAARASEFFGDRTGPKMAQLIAQGTAGIDELRQMARDTGAIMSEDFVRQAEAFNDMMKVIQTAVKGVSVQVMDGLLPALNETIRAMGTFSSDGDTMVAVGESIATVLNVAARAAIVVVTAFEAAVKAVVGLEKVLQGAVMQIVAPLEGLIRTLQVVTTALLDRDFAGAAAAFKNIGEEIRSASQAGLALTNEGLAGLGEIPGVVQGGIDRINKLANALNISRQQAVRLSDLMGGFGGEQGMGGGSTQATPMDRFLENLERQVNVVTEQTIEFQSGRRALLMFQAAQAAAASGVQLNSAEIGRQVDELLKLEKALEDERQAREQARIEREAYISGNQFIAAMEAELAAIMGGAEAYREWQREQFIMSQLQAAGTDITNEQAAAVRRLAGEIFDATDLMRNAQDGFETLGEAMGAGLNDGITRALGDENMWAALFDGDFETAGKMIGTAIGGAIGAAIGSYFGPAGTQIGAAIGSAVGSLFDKQKDPKFQLGSASAFAQTGGTPRGEFGTALGDIQFRFRKIEDETSRALKAALRDFDANLATIIGQQRLPAAMAALDSFAFDSMDDGASAEAVMEARFNLVLGTFDDFTQQFVQSVDGFEEQFQRLIDVLAVERELMLGGGLGLGGLEQTLSLIDELRRPVEGVGEAFVRLQQVTSLLDTAVALTGNTISDSRDGVIRFGDTLADVFGDDLERLSAGLNRIFSTFFSEDELLSVVADDARDLGRRLLEQLGLDVTDAMLTDAGFRELFDELFGTLGPEDTAILIEAGVAIADLIDAEDRLAAIRGDSIDGLTEAERFLNDIRRQTLALVAPMWSEFDNLNRTMADTWAEAQRLGLSEDELLRVRRLHQLQLDRFTASLRESIADLNEQLFGQDDPFANMAQSVDNSARQMRDSIVRGLEAVQDWLDRSLLDNLSTLTPEQRLGEAGDQFRSAIAAIQSGDLSQIGDLPGLADAFRREGSTFFGTSTDAFKAIEDEVRAAMQGVAGITPPQEAVQQQIADATRGTERSAFETAMLAGDLVQQMALLAQITGASPAEIAANEKLNMAAIIEALTGELPGLTGDALAEYFNELVDEVSQEIQVLMDIEALEVAQLSVLEDIKAVLTDIFQRTPYEGLPQFETGGPVTRTGPAIVHSGEIVVPRNGQLVTRGGNAENETRLLRADVRGLREDIRAVMGETNLNLREGFGAVVTAERETGRKLDRAMQPGTNRHLNNSKA